MTGFGKAETQYKDKKITIEIKSLNSKQADIFLKMPGFYKSKEIDLRNMIGSTLSRGKIDASVYVESEAKATTLKVNATLVKEYHESLVQISKLLGEKEENYLPHILGMPDIFTNEREDLEEEEWRYLQQMMQAACHALNDFRKQEGETLAAELKNRIHGILDRLEQIKKTDTNRVEEIKNRIRQHLEENVGKANIDNSRFEQELIYYLEKLDITEEKVRLKTHCDYFLSVMTEEESQGKKLGFITQEIGREINTIGSKANNAVIQKLVVEMKDELEKIKEQTLNVL